VAISLDRRNIKLLSLPDGEELATLESPYPSILHQICFNPDGTLLAANTRTRGTVLWDLRALRKQLGALNLDWQGPAYSEKPLFISTGPILTEVDYNRPKQATK
jgi:hypothetical protein